MMKEPLYCRVPTQWLADPSLCLFEWQTLLSGLLALGAAFLGASFLYKQIGQTDRLHRDELRRQHAAARTALPIALSSISGMVSEIVSNVAHALESQDNPDFETAFADGAQSETDRKMKSVSISPDVIALIQNFVETLNSQQNVRHTAELVSSIQILISRYNSFDLNGIGAVEGLYSLLLDSAKISLLNDSIYNYGRFIDEDDFSVIHRNSNATAWDMIHGKAQSAVFLRRSPDFFFGRLKERIERYKASDASPWLEKFQS